MDPQIQKTISLIKKSYDQPILFHVLYLHLSHLLARTNPLYESNDDWSKIILLSCTSNKLPNQGLEVKLQAFIKKLRPPVESNEQRLKIMVVCYYMLSRPAHLANHILLFELVTSMMGCSDHLDGLILTVLGRAVNARFYGLPENKKIREDAVSRMLESVSHRQLSNANKIKALVCFIRGDVRPFSLDFIDIQPTFFGYKCLEYICLYAKFTQNTVFIKEILPSHPEFLEGLSQYMKADFYFECPGSFKLDDAVVENNMIFDRIREAFLVASNKKKFISDMTEFLMNLK